MRHPVIAEILKHYKKLSSLEDYSWVRWAEKRLRFSETKANKFFVGVLLDQGQKAERAWDGGAHLVENHFQHQKGFWYGVSESSLSEITRICQRGYDGTSYAQNYTFNKFPSWLKSAADKMISEYDGDPRNIWAVSPEQVSLIYDRLKGFDGIGDALAKMGQFILVRNYGVAGGSVSQHLMAIKPDDLVRRVMYRAGVSPSSKAKDVIESTEKLRLKSPADFDAASWIVGREYCNKTSPKCTDCPISNGCERVGLS
jgi:endonuclease III